MNICSMSNEELRLAVLQAGGEEHFGEDAPDPDQFDSETETDEYREERDRLEEWAAELGL